MAGVAEVWAASFSGANMDIITMIKMIVKTMKIAV